MSVTDQHQTFAAEAQRFAGSLDRGLPIDVALLASNDVVHHPTVVEAATEMLARCGAIDMKLLARDAAMSRASLYRYYPDKSKLEGEIAGIGIDGMVAAAHPHESLAEKFRAAAEYLLDNPGQAAAMVPFAARVSVDVIGATIERITGDVICVPAIIGVAVMAATPGRPDGDVKAIRRYIDEIATSFR